MFVGVRNYDENDSAAPSHVSSTISSQSRVGSTTDTTITAEDNTHDTITSIFMNDAIETTEAQLEVVCNRKIQIFLVKLFILQKVLPSVVLSYSFLFHFSFFFVQLGYKATAVIALDTSQASTTPISTSTPSSSNISSPFSSCSSLTSLKTSENNNILEDKNENGIETDQTTEAQNVENESENENENENTYRNENSTFAFSSSSSSTSSSASPASSFPIDKTASFSSGQLLSSLSSFTASWSSFSTLCRSFFDISIETRTYVSITQSAKNNRNVKKCLHSYKVYKNIKIIPFDNLKVIFTSDALTVENIQKELKDVNDSALLHFMLIFAKIPSNKRQLVKITKLDEKIVYEHPSFNMVDIEKEVNLLLSSPLVSSLLSPSSFSSTELTIQTPASPSISSTSSALVSLSSSSSSSSLLSAPLLGEIELEAEMFAYSPMLNKSTFKGGFDLFTTKMVQYNKHRTLAMKTYYDAIITFYDHIWKHLFEGPIRDPTKRTRMNRAEKKIWEHVSNYITAKILITKNEIGYIKNACRYIDSFGVDLFLYLFSNDQKVTRSVTTVMRCAADCTFKRQCISDQQYTTQLHKDWITAYYNNIDTIKGKHPIFYSTRIHLIYSFSKSFVVVFLFFFVSFFSSS